MPSLVYIALGLLGVSIFGTVAWAAVDLYRAALQDRRAREELL
jgi:hypothetical protein